MLYGIVHWRKNYIQTPINLRQLHSILIYLQVPEALYDFSGDITDLSNYFVTSEGNNFFTVFSAALSKAQALGAPLKIQTI